jgi:hypothetical protein
MTLIPPNHTAVLLAVLDVWLGPQAFSIPIPYSLFPNAYPLTPSSFTDFSSIYNFRIISFLWQQREFGSAYWQNELEWRCTGVIYPRLNLRALNVTLTSGSL